MKPKVMYVRIPEQLKNEAIAALDEEKVDVTQVVLLDKIQELSGSRPEQPVAGGSYYLHFHSDSELIQFRLTYPEAEVIELPVWAMSAARKIKKGLK